LIEEGTDMKHIMLWGMCDCVFMAAFVVAAILSILAIGL
jgi:hypothetical protein